VAHETEKREREREGEREREREREEREEREAHRKGIYFKSTRERTREPPSCVLHAALRRYTRRGLPFAGISTARYDALADAIKEIGASR
jgi:hypothetical protein